MQRLFEFRGKKKKGTVGHMLERIPVSAPLKINYYHQENYVIITMHWILPRFLKK